MNNKWSSSKNPFIDLALSSWMEQNPQEVLTYCVEEDAELLNNTALTWRLTGELTKDSPEQAWTWMATLNKSTQSDVIQNFFTSLLENHPNRMDEFIRKLTVHRKLPEKLDGINDAKLIKNITANWSKKNPEAALKWINELPEEWKKTALTSFPEKTTTSSKM